MKTKKIVIIGGGIAGLSAGCYARMNGFDAEVIEMHTQSGGLCTSWKRKGFEIDGCIHWLCGAGETSEFHEFWEELGAVQGRAMHFHESFGVYRDTAGNEFTLYADADRLEEHIRALSPADSALAEELASFIRDFAKIPMAMDKARELMNPVDLFKMMRRMAPFFPLFGKVSKYSIADYAARFQHPLVREGLMLSLGQPKTSLMSLVATMADLHRKGAGWPMGGSLEFAKAIEKRYLGLGGKLRLGTKVKDILIEKGKAVGVRLVSGEEIRADEVISAMDGRTVLFEMLGGNYLDKGLRELYRDHGVYTSSVQVSLVVKRDLSGDIAPMARIYELSKPLTSTGKPVEWLMVKHYAHDPAFVRDGKTTLIALLPADSDFWLSLREKTESYEAQKKLVWEEVIERLEKYYPGIGGQIEVSDVATPATYVRYTGNTGGAYMTWYLRPGEQMGSIRKTLPGLKNFTMCGMWTMSPGGLPTALITARDSLQLICARNGRKFRTEKP